MHFPSQLDETSPRSLAANFARLLGIWLGIAFVSCTSVGLAEFPFTDFDAVTSSPWTRELQATSEVDCRPHFSPPRHPTFNTRDLEPELRFFDLQLQTFVSETSSGRSRAESNMRTNFRRYCEPQHERPTATFEDTPVLRSEIIRAQSPPLMYFDSANPEFDMPLIEGNGNTCHSVCGPPYPGGCPMAYPTQFLAGADGLSFCKDVQDFPRRLQSDISSFATCENVLFLGVAAGITVALRDNVDDRVIHDTQMHGPRWGQFSNVLSHGGDALAVHAPILATMYITSLCEQDDDLHELTLTMFTGYKFAILSSLGLQYITGTHDSNGGIFNLMGDHGFPSEPMAGSFALAAILDERFGWRGGLPAYLISGLIGFSEIDQQRHTVSDVVFGAALGYVIGKSVGAQRYRPNSPYKLVPFFDAISGTQGMGFQVVY